MVAKTIAAVNIYRFDFDKAKITLSMYNSYNVRIRVILI